MSKRKPSGFHPRNDRLSIFQKLVDAGIPTKQANYAAGQVARGLWDLKGDVILGASDRPVLHLPQSKAG